MAQRILILGGTGMLGHNLFKTLRKNPDFEVYATVRALGGLSRWFSLEELQNIRGGVEVADLDSIIRALASIQPDIVINCIGLIKQSSLANDPLTAILLNSLLPHRLALLCQAVKARMIHISTDCVFNGMKGNYTEDDPSDALDLYGRSKFLGEVSYPNCVTLRTSIIGHEIREKLGLVEWFMSQQGRIRGFTQALFSGFPTIEIARIIENYVIPNTTLTGLYQVSASAISKYDLLKLIDAEYGKNIEIVPDRDFIVNRVLNSQRFATATGYAAPDWPKLVTQMHQQYLSEPCYR
jgi:dTDP-4-dehydrorhamnose reductase